MSDPVLTMDDLATYKKRGKRGKLPYSHTKIRQLVKEGDFPPPFKLGERRMVWYESEIDEWLKSKKGGAGA